MVNVSVPFVAGSRQLMRRRPRKPTPLLTSYRRSGRLNARLVNNKKGTVPFIRLSQFLRDFGDPITVQIAVLPVAEKAAIGVARLSGVAVLFVNLAEEVEAPHVLNRPGITLVACIGH